MKPPYYLLEEGHPTGPHSLIVLHQKADIRVIGPNSTVRPAESPDAPWIPIRMIPDLHEFLFPPKTAPTLASSRPAAHTKPPFTESAPRPVEVESMLRDNTARLVASEHFDPGAMSSRRLRRHRTFLFTVLFFAAPAWALYRFGPFPRTEITIITLAGFVGVAALMSYWIIYHIADFRS